MDYIAANSPQLKILLQHCPQGLPNQKQLEWFCSSLNDKYKLFPGVKTSKMKRAIRDSMDSFKQMARAIRGLAGDVSKRDRVIIDPEVAKLVKMIEFKHPPNKTKWHTKSKIKQDKQVPHEVEDLTVDSDEELMGPDPHASSACSGLPDLYSKHCASGDGELSDDGDLDEDKVEELSADSDPDEDKVEKLSDEDEDEHEPTLGSPQMIDLEPPQDDFRLFPAISG